MAALAVTLGGGIAQAQKIVWIDMQAAMLATSDGKKAGAAIDAKFTPVKADLDKLQKTITDKQDQFTKGRATMSPAALGTLQTEIASLTTQLKRKQEDAQQDLQEEESKQFAPIMQKLTQVINTYAALNQVTLVIDASANPNNLLIADKSLNIVEPVVLAYEKQAGGTPAPAAPAPGAAKPPAASTPAPKATAPAK